MVSLLLHWGSCPATAGGLFWFHIPNIGESELRSTSLISVHLLYCGTLCHPGEAPTSSPQSLAHLHSLSWPCSHLSCPSPHLIPNPHSSPHSLHLPLMTILFPLLSEIQASSLVPSFLFSYFGSVNYSMGILYFMANIHL